MKVRNLENRQGRNVVNQFIIEHEQKVYFQSYDSLCAVWDCKEQKLKLGRDWDYSRTTMKYTKVFIEQFTPYDVESKRDIEKLIKAGDVEYDNRMH